MECHWHTKHVRVGELEHFCFLISRLEIINPSQLLLALKNRKAEAQKGSRTCPVSRRDKLGQNPFLLAPVHSSLYYMERTGNVRIYFLFELSVLGVSKQKKVLHNDIVDLII